MMDKICGLGSLRLTQPKPSAMLGFTTYALRAFLRLQPNLR